MAERDQEEERERRCLRGDHPYIVARLDEHGDEDNGDEDQLPKAVLSAEVENINARRAINGKSRYKLDCCQPTGLALSGGGIRSASFCLGAILPASDWKTSTIFRQSRAVAT